MPWDDVTSEELQEMKRTGWWYDAITLGGMGFALLLLTVVCLYAPQCGG